MTSNLGSEDIRAAAPKLHKLVAATENRHEQYLRAIKGFTNELYPVLTKALKRDEFLGRINQIMVFLPLNDHEVNNEAIVISDFIDDLLSFYNRQISQVIEIELKKWQKRAEDQHAIRLSWSPEGELNSLAWFL